MAFLEWRRFNFFDVVKDVDGGKLAETLGDARLTAYSSGNGILVFGDSDGNVHLISRNFTISTFRAYDRNISLAEMSKESSFLVTIGEDEIGINPVIKVWNVDKQDRHGHPSCIRISRASLPNRAISTSCICINSALTLMAVGFLDGSILFYRGDIKRERANKKKVLQEGKQSITGLAFRETEKCTYLFVVTLISVEFYDVTHKDKEVKTSLDNVGCSPRCSVLMDSVKDSYFMICKSNAIYCYSTDGLGPCYAIDGEKVMLQWFRSYLVIVAKESKQKSQNSTTPPIGNQGNSGTDSEHHTLTVLDIQNKFIVFSVPMKAVQAVLAEWGSFYIVTGTNSICQLAEKDLQSKLALLFKKNFYDVSIRIAKSHQYDSEGLIDIFRQYGDHLYSKGDHNGAIEQYIKTIGSLEPSYVIRKFLASHQIDNLTTYLQALHKQGVATADHTTLLLNCYTKLNQVEKLKDFIMTEDRELDFDVEVAINVCRQSSSEDALMLARKHNLHSWYLKIQIEDNHQYSAALDYISKLEFSEAVENMKKYGGILLEKAPKETTQFLKTLCTDYKPSVDQKLVNGIKQGSGDSAHPEDFLHLFVNNSESLVDFLEHLVQKSNKWGMFIYNTLIEHYLQIWSKLSDTTTRLQYELKIMKLLESPDCNCDKHHVLILCQAVNFRSGLLHLYEENKMYQQILQYHLSQGDYQSIITCCRRFGNQDSNLWVQTLWAGARDANVPPYLLSEILGVIEKERLLSPLEVIDAVCSWKSVKIGDVRSYLNSILQNELKTADHEQTLILKYTQETARIRKLIKNLQNSPVTFQGSRCSACNNQLEIPSVHFLCQHSFHQHCFQSFSEHDNECPACLPNNKQIVDVIRAQVQKSDLHETFHSQLERAEDGFSLVADYFGRGIFNKFTVINDSTLRSRSISSSRSDSIPPVLKPSYTPHFTEVKLQKPERPKELGKQKMSLERYSSMLEANLTRDQHTALTPRSDSPETPLVSVLANKQSSLITGKNPFEDDDDYNQKESSKGYPQSSNPFYEDDDDDYDKNLNPFSS